MNPKWYPGYYLDPQHWPEWMPEVFPHWLPAAMVRTPPAIPPQSWPESSSKPSSALFGDLLQEPRPKSLGEQLAALPNILPDISKPATPQPNADRRGGLVPLPPEPEPDARASLPASATTASSSRPLTRWPDSVMTTAGVPAKIAGWSWDVMDNVPALPVQWPSASTSQFPATPPRSPVPHMQSADYWGAGLTPAVEPLWNPLPVLPEAQSPDRPSGSASAVGETEPAPAIDEVAAAEEARRAGAMRTGQWGRRNKKEFEGYTAPLAMPQQDENNPDLSERRRLNLLDSYYRGTLFGSARLALLEQLNKLSDDGVSPATKRVRDELRKEYQQIASDLARYDRMPRFQNPSEFGVAALGQLGGGMLSPESLIGLGAKGATWLGRTLKAGVQQGAISVAADPIVQGLNIEAGVQDKYDPWRTALAGGVGVGAGALLTGLGQGLRSLVAPRRAAIYAPHEGVPGDRTGHVPEVARQSYEYRADYSGNQWKNPVSGHDTLQEAAARKLDLSLETRPTLDATGSYEPRPGVREINPANSARSFVRLTHDGELSEWSKRVLDAVEATRAIMDGQNEAWYHVVINSAPPAQRTSLDIPYHRQLTKTEMLGLNELAPQHGLIVVDRGDGVSLISPPGGKSAEEIKALLGGQLGDQIKAILPDAVPQQVKITPYNVDLKDEFARGRGAATDKWVDLLEAAPPGTLEALRTDPVINIIAARHARDAGLHGVMGPVSVALQHLRDFAVQHQWDRVREAVRRNPALFPALLVTLGLRQVDKQEASRGD